LTKLKRPAKVKSGREPPERSLLSCSLRASTPKLHACEPRTQRSVSRNSKVFSAKTPGVVSAHGGPKRSRSPGMFSISMRGMPKLVSDDDSISLKAKRVALTRASLTTVCERTRVHVAVPKRFCGSVRMSPIGRLRPAESPPSPLKLE
jgi:hypothetical protein